MAMNHMIKHHVLIPAGVFVVALSVGAPLSTAFVVAMMGGGGHHHGNHRGHGAHDHHDAPSDRELT